MEKTGTKRVMYPLLDMVRYTLHDLSSVKELFDNCSNNLHLKTLFYLISSSEIPSDHEQFRDSMHSAMTRIGHGDYTLYPLYDQAILNLVAQQMQAEARKAEKHKQDEALRLEQMQKEEAEHRQAEQNRQILAQIEISREEITKARLELRQREEAARQREQITNARLQECIERETRFEKRRARLRKQKNKRRS